jgi:hypothetical protein
MKQTSKMLRFKIYSNFHERVKLATNSLELLNKASDFLKDRLLLGFELREGHLGSTAFAYGDCLE